MIGKCESRAARPLSAEALSGGSSREGCSGCRFARGGEGEEGVYWQVGQKTPILGLLIRDC